MITLKINQIPSRTNGHIKYWSNLGDDGHIMIAVNFKNKTFETYHYSYNFEFDKRSLEKIYFEDVKHEIPELFISQNRKVKYLKLEDFCEI